MLAVEGVQHVPLPSKALPLARPLSSAPGSFLWIYPKPCLAHRQGAAAFGSGVDIDGEGACAAPLLSGFTIPHPVLVFGKLGSGICFVGSADDGAAGAGVDGFAGGAGFICACASPAVPSAANSATA
jgi:hypothetical protein